MSARLPKQSSTPSVAKSSKSSKQDVPAVVSLSDVKPVKVEKVEKVEKEVNVTKSYAAVAAPVPVKRAAKRAASAQLEATSKKTVSVSEVKPAAAAVVLDVTDSAPTVEVCTSTHNAFMSKLQTLAALVATIKSDFRLIEKQVSRELKIVARLNEKRKRKSGNRSPSGFTKPTLISDTLAVFLNRSPGTELARTEVTREINQYIRSNDLQDKQNGRRINADVKLSELLGLVSTDELTYFNLQRFMSRHFVKKSDEVTV